MPKSQIRYKHTDTRGRSCSSNVIVQSGLTRRSLFLSTPPRKVSFEDSRNDDSNRSICSDNTISTKNKKTNPASETIESELEERPPIRRKRSLLVRPITSLSLVDLANSIAHDGVSPVISGQIDADRIEGRQSKRICSFNLSPRSVVHTTDVNEQNLFSLLSSSEGESNSLRTSPWGHFIDTAPDEDNYDSLSTTVYSNYGCTNRRRTSSCLCNESLCRTRRRPTPYDEYKSYTAREAQPTLSFAGLRTDSKSKRNFRLSLRSKYSSHESADQLIRVFSELQVQRVQQNTT